jgi:hypothetical protein
VLGTAASWWGLDRVLGLWNVRILEPCCSDLRSILAAGESRAAGFDPLVENPADPWGRPMNYPGIWEVLSACGLNGSHAVTLGIGLAAVFAVAVAVFPARRTNAVTCTLLLATVLSPASLLAVERGNIDLVVFVLLALAILLGNNWD